MRRQTNTAISYLLYCDSPEEMLQLGVQVPDERPTSHNLSMTVIEGQTSIAHVFTIDALCPCGHADDLSLLHISTCTRSYEDIILNMDTDLMSSYTNCCKESQRSVTFNPNLIHHIFCHRGHISTALQKSRNMIPGFYLHPTAHLWAPVEPCTLYLCLICWCILQFSDL